MGKDFNFSVPEKKQKSNTVNKIIVIFLLIVVVLTLVNLLMVLNLTKKPDKTASLSAQQIKELASKLAQRNLYLPAVKVWNDYLAAGDLTDTERAGILFQIGTLLEKASDYQQAIEYFYRSEITAKLAELEPQINSHIKDCFEKLGKFSDLRYELMDRTSFKKTEAAGTKIVAEMDSEKISEADLDAIIENSIDNQLSPMAAFMTADQLNNEKKKMLEEYKNPQTKLQFLQSWLAQEVLYRQAMAEGYMEKPEVKKTLDELLHNVLSQQLLNAQLASKINIAESDLRTYYAANKDKYVDPAKAQISHILVDNRQDADDVLAAIEAGKDFAVLAKKYSKDNSTKEIGGKIEEGVFKGSYIPVIGESKELNEKIFAAKTPAVLAEPFKTEKGWEIIKVENITNERQKNFDEVSRQVQLALLNQKRRDIQQEYIAQMMDKYKVIIHSSEITGANQSESTNDKAK